MIFTIDIRSFITYVPPTEMVWTIEKQKKRQHEGEKITIEWIQAT